MYSRIITLERRIDNELMTRTNASSIVACIVNNHYHTYKGRGSQVEKNTTGLLHFGNIFKYIVDTWSL